MKRLSWIVFAAALACCVCGSAQENAPVPDSTRTVVQVYEAGKRASFPELLPSDLSSIITDNCGNVATGEVELSFLVDAEGRTHHVMLVRAIGNDLDRLAVLLAKANRFKPAMLDSVPVAVALTDRIKMNGCVVMETNAAGQHSNHLRLRSQPDQLLKAMPNAPKTVMFSSGKQEPGHIGGRVSAPVPILTFPPQFSEEAKQNRTTGECMIQVIIDAEGFPMNPRVVRPLGSGLDEKAIEAVMHYRFRPGMLDGNPVPVYMTIAVNFR